jgi:hypothetical protein
VFDRPTWKSSWHNQQRKRNASGSESKIGSCGNSGSGFFSFGKFSIIKFPNTNRFTGEGNKTEVILYLHGQGSSHPEKGKNSEVVSSMVQNIAQCENVADCQGI